MMMMVMMLMMVVMMMVMMMKIVMVMVMMMMAMMMMVVVDVIMTVTLGARAVHLLRPRRDARALRRQTARVRIRDPRPIIGPECAERRIARRRRVGRFWR